MELMRRLQEEEPLLHVVWKERVQEIQVQVMGEVQIEVLKRMLVRICPCQFLSRTSSLQEEAYAMPPPRSFGSSRRCTSA